MAKSNARSTKAYNEVRRNGGSKEEARAVSAQVYEKTTKEDFNRFMAKSSNYNEDGSDFDSDLNGNGTDWHTSEDL
ncbi:hypothetical protein [Flavobacterium phage FL-1]|nr:hypothetical protein [Flavobacterium phage FL-1]